MKTFAIAIIGILAALLLLTRRQLALAEQSGREVMFAEKAFYRTAGAYAYCAGTLTGEAVLYPNNTTAVSCYRDRMECVVSRVQQIGPNQIGRLDSPDILPVTTWTDDDIIAEGPADAVGCRKTRIRIDQVSESVQWSETLIQPPIDRCKDAESKPHIWTIEDSPGRRRLDGSPMK